MDLFVPPCSVEYGCKPEGLKKYSDDGNKSSFLKCSCNLIWRDTSRFSEPRFYDEEYFRHRDYARRMNSRIKHSKLFISLLEKHASPGRMLEVGPGMGESMIAASERGWSVCGLDTCEYVCRQLSERSFNVENASLVNSALPKRTFDAIFMKHSLEHHENPFETLRLAREFLREGGIIEIIVPDASYGPAERKRERHRFYNSSGEGLEHYVYFKKSTLGRMLEHTGFEVLSDSLPLIAQGSTFSFSERVELFFRRAIPLLGTRRELVFVARKK